VRVGAFERSSDGLLVTIVGFLVITCVGETVEIRLGCVLGRALGKTVGCAEGRGLCW